MSTSTFFVSVFTDSLRLTANVAFLLTFDHVVNRSSRKWLLVFVCASRLCLSSKLLASSLCLVAPCISSSSAGFSAGSSFLSSCISGAAGEGARGLHEGCPTSSTLVSVVFRQLLGGFLLTSCAQRVVGRCAYTTLSSVLTRCSSVRSLLPTADFHLSAQLRWKTSQHRFAKLQHLSTIRTTHRTIERGLCIVALETRNEPSCMSNNPFHHCTVSGWSVLRAVLQSSQHGAHLSLQLFLIVLHCTVALMRSSWTTSDDCSFLTFGFHTCCPHDE